MEEAKLEKRIEILQQKTVTFQGDEKASDGLVYVPIRPICEYLGLSFAGQSQRLGRDDILSEVRQRVDVETASGTQSMVCLPIEFFNGWLFGIQSSRVKKEYRDKVRDYKLSCHYALAQAFSPKALGPYEGPSIGLNITLRLVEDFNDLRESVKNQQMVLDSQQMGIYQMLSQMKAEIKQLKGKIEESDS